MCKRKQAGLNAFRISHSHKFYVFIHLLDVLEVFCGCTDCRRADVSETDDKRSDKRKILKRYAKQCLNKASHLDKEAEVSFTYQWIEK